MLKLLARKAECQLKITALSPLGCIVEKLVLSCFSDLGSFSLRQLVTADESQLYCLASFFTSKV